MNTRYAGFLDHYMHGLSRDDIDCDIDNSHVLTKRSRQNWQSWTKNQQDDTVSDHLQVK